MVKDPESCSRGLFQGVFSTVSSRDWALHIKQERHDQSYTPANYQQEEFIRFSNKPAAHIRFVACWNSELVLSCGVKLLKWCAGSELTRWDEQLNSRFDSLSTPSRGQPVPTQWELFWFCCQSEQFGNSYFRPNYVQIYENCCRDETWQWTDTVFLQGVFHMRHKNSSSSTSDWIGRCS